MLQVPSVLHRIMQDSDDLNHLVSPNAIENNMSGADYAAFSSLQHVE